MGTEITKSKISQELYDQGFANEELEIDSDIFYRASTAIDELNQRLIDQTAAGMERGKKDQEEIKRLNRELKELHKVINPSLHRVFKFGFEIGGGTVIEGGYGDFSTEDTEEMMQDCSLPELAEFRAKYPQKEDA